MKTQGLADPIRGPIADVRELAGPDALLMYGAATCEDTAVTRSRLRALGVPFREIDVDLDPAARDRLSEFERGRPRTPTLVFGDRALIAVEPSLQELDDLVAAAGYPVNPPVATEYHGSRASIPLPLWILPSVGGNSFSLESIKGRHPAAIFFAHDAACLACYGYAKRLAKQCEALAEAEAVPIVVVRSEPEAAAHWRQEITEDVTILADAAGAWKSAVAGALDEPPGFAALIVVDRFGAPRAGSFALEAGGLIAPAEIAAWLRFLAPECPECGGEIPWFDGEVATG
jgi:glutaredoxin/peroxiredoxin